MGLRYTGERPIPGAMPNTIFNGVIARYILAKKLMNRVHGNKILDVGCGTGIGSGYLATKGFSVTGIDIDPESLQWGTAKKLHPDLAMIEGQGERLPFDNEIFDIVIAFECIEHMDSPYAFILEAKRILKPGGILICSVPYCIGDVLAELLNGGSNPYHIQRFTPQTMRHLLSHHFLIRSEFGQQFHHIYYYTYVFVNHIIWDYLKAIPLAGNILLKWRNKRISGIAISNSMSDEKSQMNYELWREDDLPLEWKPAPIEPGTKKIPETLIFLSHRL